MWVVMGRARLCHKRRERLEPRYHFRRRCVLSVQEFHKGRGGKLVVEQRLWCGVLGIRGLPDTVPRVHLDGLVMADLQNLVITLPDELGDLA